jgi:pimeloyl-ACP methyl ester carboxylesterase
VVQLGKDGSGRVTVVGASMGGTVASVSAARAGADAVVNLSGFGYGSIVTAPAIAALTIPVLGTGSHAEQTDSERLNARSPHRRAPRSGSSGPTWDTGGRSSWTVRGPTRPRRPSGAPDHLDEG